MKKLMFALSFFVVSTAVAQIPGSIPPAQQAIIDHAKAKAMSVHEACKNEKVSACKEQKPEAKWKECLMQNFEKLSDPCKSTLKPM